MSLVIPFRGKAELRAEDNLAAFIKYATDHSPFAGIDQSKNAWDLTKFVKQRNRGHDTSWVHFCSWRDTTGNRQVKTDFMREPFLLFAKAAFNELMRRKILTEYRRFIVALQAIEQALIDLDLEPSVVHVTQDVMNRAAEMLAQRFRDPWSVGRNLERIVNEFINPGRLSTVDISWRSTYKFKNPPRNDVVNKQGVNEDSKDRLPDPRAILALGDIFAKSDHLPDKIVTAYVALAMFAPSRASEVLSLPVDCIRTATEGEESLMGLKWLPAKGGEPVTKYAISDASEEVARMAIDFLHELGKPARAAADWYGSNPDKLYLPPGTEHLRGQPLTLWEISLIFGKTKEIRSRDVGIDKYDFTRLPAGVTTDRSRISPNQQKATWVSLWTFESVEAYALSRLAPGFPILDDQTNLLWKDALFVLPANVLRPDAELLPHMPENISISSINHQLGGNPNGRTIFSRNDKLDQNGKPWIITTHQFRHFLNTLAQSKYLSQNLIAFWSGRKDVKQNEWYNHLPQEAFIEAYLKLEEYAPKVGVVGPLKEKATNRAAKECITFDQALKLEIGAIHVTRFGLCRHDYALTPCPKDKDCVNCGDHYVVKGDERHLKEAKFQVKLHQQAVQKCEEAIENGEIGVPKWLNRHQEHLGRWQVTVKMLEDASIPPNTIISLPQPLHSQAKTGLAENIRNTNLKKAEGR